MTCLESSWDSLIAQLVKNLPAMQKTLVQCLSWKDSLEKAKPSHFSILALRIPWTIQMGIPHHLTCLLRNLFAGQEATFRTGHGTTNWFHIGKGVHQGCILSPCLFNFYAESIMQNARLDESRAGIKIARRNINNLRYADDTTLMAESEEELKSLLMRVKEKSEKLS